MTLWDRWVLQMCVHATCHRYVASRRATQQSGRVCLPHRATHMSKATGTDTSVAYCGGGGARRELPDTRQHPASASARDIHPQEQDCTAASTGQPGYDATKKNSSGDLYLKRSSGSENRYSPSFCSSAKTIWRQRTELLMGRLHTGSRLATITAMARTTTRLLVPVGAIDDVLSLKAVRQSNLRLTGE